MSVDEVAAEISECLAQAVTEPSTRRALLSVYQAVIAVERSVPKRYENVATLPFGERKQYDHALVSHCYDLYDAIKQIPHLAEIAKPRRFQLKRWTPSGLFAAPTIGLWIAQPHVREMIERYTKNQERETTFLSRNIYFRRCKYPRENLLVLADVLPPSSAIAEIRAG